MNRPLTYEPSLPPDQLHLRCDPAGFTLTLPPNVPSRVAAAAVGVGMGAMGVWWALTMPRPGRVEAWPVWLLWWLFEVFIGGCSVLAILGSVQTLRTLRLPTTLSLHDDVLVCNVPGPFVASTKRVATNELAGAHITLPDSEGGGVMLVARRRDGGTERLLNRSDYAEGHVEYAAEVLKEWLGDAAAIRSARVCEGRPCPRCGATAFNRN